MKLLNQNISLWSASELTALLHNMFKIKDLPYKHLDFMDFFVVKYRFIAIAYLRGGLLNDSILTADGWSGGCGGGFCCAHRCLTDSRLLFFWTFLCLRNMRSQTRGHSTLAWGLWWDYILAVAWNAGWLPTISCGEVQTDWASHFFRWSGGWWRQRNRFIWWFYCSFLLGWLWWQGRRQRPVQGLQ